MPRKSAKQIVNEVIAKVDEKLETPRLSNKSKPATKKDVIKETVEHFRQCMVNVSPGNNCNCPASRN